ncbi:MAG: tRNA preQ1(34) S-adenosylmethionine ribosyltransferase-isomerase QueA [Clostridia bacterium]|nr:tRNA preQ1(34) S-adenosylmethionine ribosyltransferase-isomerase QueA [Clostridia bacterium]
MIENKRCRTDLLTHDFYYDLPEELIAQHPAKKRDGSRLLVLDKEEKSLEHRIFSDIVDYIRPEDVLVINDSKVIPARLIGCAEGAPEKSIEILLLKQCDEPDTWECLTRPGKRAKIGRRFEFGDGKLRAEVTGIVDEGNRTVKFEYSEDDEFFALLDEVGAMPLPPYIHSTDTSNDRYQTVYANERGSAAAPTAGLHFTEALLDKIKAQGTAVVPVMLHVGLGTFRPVKADKITDHVMHAETITVTREAADIINERKAKGGRLICVGTTSCRTIESAADENGIIHPVSTETKIFIYPGYKFKAMDALITNFHLPESSLLMLVSAFADKEFIMDAYKKAVEEKYRFFSFGDAMLIV